MGDQFEFKCPQCGQPVSADESLRGLAVPCPHCEKGIVVPGPTNRKSFPAKCPYCGSEYEIDACEVGRKGECGICHKSFILKPHLLEQLKHDYAKLFCKKCGNKIKQNDVFCTKCGNPVSKSLPIASNVLGQPQTGAQAQDIPNTSLLPAIVATILAPISFCGISFPLGMAAIVFAIIAKSRLGSGDIAGAKSAKKVSNVLVGLSLIFVCLLVVLLVGNHLFMVTHR